jgi:hypothetical protein
MSSKKLLEAIRVIMYIVIAVVIAMEIAMRH